MALTSIPKKAFSFLEELRGNNNRNWFAEHKDTYLESAALMADFAGSLLTALNRHDVIETPSGAKSQYRIYRDVRFSADKTPYSTYFGGRFRRAGRARRGGYYYHFEPGGRSFILGGFWGPNAQDLKLIRDDIAYDATPLRQILNSSEFISSFGTLSGERLKTAPKGYENYHGAIDLLQYKQYLVKKQFTDAEVLHPGFLEQADHCLKNMRPFLDYMSGVLAVDANGLPLIPE